MFEFGKQIPGLSKLFGELENAAKAAREAASRGGSAFAAGAQQLTGALGKLALGFGTERFIKGISIGQDRITQFSRQLNISRSEADELNRRFVRLGGDIAGIRPKEFRRVFT